MYWPIPLKNLSIRLINLETITVLAYFIETLSVSPCYFRD